MLPPKPPIVCTLNGTSPAGRLGSTNLPAESRGIGDIGCKRSWAMPSSTPRRFTPATDRVAENRQVGADNEPALSVEQGGVKVLLFADERRHRSALDQRFHLALRRRCFQIGRASCRERVYVWEVSLS